MKKLFIILAVVCMLCSVECYSQDKVVAKDVFKKAGYRILKAQLNGAIQPDCEINYIGKDPDNIESVELVFREEKYQKTIITIIRWEALEKDSVFEEDLFINQHCGDSYYVIGRGSVVEISYNDKGEVADRKITKKDTIRYRITHQFFYALKSIMDESITYKEDKYYLYPGLEDRLDFFNNTQTPRVPNRDRVEGVKKWAKWAALPRHMGIKPQEGKVFKQKSVFLMCISTATLKGPFEMTER